MTIEELKKLLEPTNYTVVLIDDPDAKMFGDYAWIRRGDPPDWNYIDGTPEDILDYIRGMINEQKSE